MRWFNKLRRVRDTERTDRIAGARLARRRPLLESLEDRRLLAAQVFTPTIPELGATITFDVVYTALDDNAVQDNSIKTTGVSLRMHYDSTEVSPDIAAIASSAFSGATIQASDDTTSDFDNDLATDRFVNFLWFDIAGQFPTSSQLPLTLFSADFDSVAAFDALPNIRFSGSPPPGFEFRSQPLTASGAWTNPSNRFDVNNENGVTALDALAVINELARHTVFDPATGVLTPIPPNGFAPPFYDVNVDGKISAVDALQIINELARGGNPEPTALAAGRSQTKVDSTMPEASAHGSVRQSKKSADNYQLHAAGADQWLSDEEFLDDLTAWETDLAEKI